QVPRKCTPATGHALDFGLKANTLITKSARLLYTLYPSHRLVIPSRKAQIPELCPVYYHTHIFKPVSQNINAGVSFEATHAIHRQWLVYIYVGLD
ncbi:unnamed protein product, partial [Mycena citricolor]